MPRKEFARTIGIGLAGLAYHCARTLGCRYHHWRVNRIEARR